MMEEYNRNDVILLEKVYDRLKPWIKNHVNHGVYESGLCCTNCASINYKRSGWAYTTAHKYQRYCCKDCGTWFKASMVNMVGEPKRFSSIS
jgi:hypothetical protein